MGFRKDLLWLTMPLPRRCAGTDGYSGSCLCINSPEFTTYSREFPPKGNDERSARLSCYRSLIYYLGLQTHSPNLDARMGGDVNNPMWKSHCLVALPCPSRAGKPAGEADAHLRLPQGTESPRPQEGSIDFLSEAPCMGSQISSFFRDGAFLKCNLVKLLWGFVLVKV